MHRFTARWILSAVPCPGFCLFPTFSLSSPPGEITKPSLRDGPAANPKETFWDPQLPSNTGPVLLSPTCPPAQAFISGVRTPPSASPGSLPQLHVAAAASSPCSARPGGQPQVQGTQSPCGLPARVQPLRLRTLRRRSPSCSHWKPRSLWTPPAVSPPPRPPQTSTPHMNSTITETCL